MNHHPNNRKPLVAIDAGVSKKAQGRASFDGSFQEAEFTFDLQRRLQKLLHANGIDTVLTMPDEDRPAPQLERCMAANQAAADILISLRAAAFGQDWNTDSGWGAFVYRRGSRAEELAQSIRRASIPLLGLADRGVMESPQCLLRKAQMPAVRIEHGFYTNREELSRLQDDAYRDACAKADCDGIMDYFQAYGENADQRKSIYQKIRQIHVIRIPLERFRIQWWDQNRYTDSVGNYAGCGHFFSVWDEGIRHTLPLANLCADFQTGSANIYAIRRLREKGCISGNKVICSSGDFALEFQEKAPHTLLIPKMGVPSIEPLSKIPEGTAYAIAGAPVILGGRRVPYSVVRQDGWNESISDPGFHSFLGISGRTVVYAAFPTQSPNLFESGEAYEVLSSFQLEAAIEVGGCGLAIRSRGAFQMDKGENKMVNTIITF